MNAMVGKFRGSNAATLLVGGAAFLRSTLHLGISSSIIPTLLLGNANASHHNSQGCTKSFFTKSVGWHTKETTKARTNTTMPQLNRERSQQEQRRRTRGRYQVFLAVGSNQGDSFASIDTGLQLLCDPTFSDDPYLPTELVRSSFLYYTKPMYVTDQPSFWNGAVELDTDYDPPSLLRRLKRVEEYLGRNFTQIRNGPRPLDMDILLYYDNDNIDKESSEAMPTSASVPLVVETPNLVIPHCRLQEREFVLAPLIDVAGRSLIHPTSSTASSSGSEQELEKDTTLGDILDNLVRSKENSDADEPSAIRLLPLPRERFLLFDRTLIMGILNVTPDSFSDGGKWTDDVDRAVARAKEMVEEGATIIDIGGESTRPGATEIEVEEQIRRTVPVIEALRKQSKEVVVSIDTRHAAVAKAAIEAGADIVNDVSGGSHDPNMLSTVADLKVPIVLMHMRGTPESMQGLTDYDDQGGVVDGVTKALLDRSRAAEEAGIPRWLQILDPGIGFAKDIDGNLSLLKHYSDLRMKLGDFPLLLGTSRKGFIGKLSGESEAEKRDFGTVASCVAALCLGKRGNNSSLGCNILRVHNVKGAKQAIAVMDAIIEAQ